MRICVFEKPISSLITFAFFLLLILCTCKEFSVVYHRSSPKSHISFCLCHFLYLYLAVDIWTQLTVALLFHWVLYCVVLQLRLKYWCSLFLLCSNLFTCINWLRSVDSCWYLKAIAFLNFHILDAFYIPNSKDLTHCFGTYIPSE